MAAGLIPSGLAADADRMDQALTAVLAMTAAIFTAYLAHLAERRTKP